MTSRSDTKYLSKLWLQETPSVAFHHTGSVPPFSPIEKMTLFLLLTMVSVVSEPRNVTSPSVVFPLIWEKLQMFQVDDS